MDLSRRIDEEYIKVCEQIRMMDNANKIAPSEDYDIDRAYFVGRKSAFEFLMKLQG